MKEMFGFHRRDSMDHNLAQIPKYLKVIGASCQNTWDIIGWNLKYYNIPKNMSTECMGKRFVHRAEIVAATK